jgi:hypothetical protein
MNIGIATGEASGFFVVDVDPDHGGDDALRGLEREHGQLPTTVRQLTGGGGEHILFRNVTGLKNSAGRIAKGLDVRSDGGYIVVAPSVHASGRRYTWSVDHHPSDVVIAEAPAWLIGLARGPAAGTGTPVAHPAERWVDALSQPCREGRRNDMLARLTGYLLRRYVDPYVVLELVRLWNQVQCQPPIEDAEMLRTVNSICLREAQRRGADLG